MRPHDRDFFLGSETDQLRILPRIIPENRVTLRYELGAKRHDIPTPHPLLQISARRPSQVYPASPSEIDVLVHQVLVSLDGNLILVEIFGSTRQAKRGSDCLLIETSNLVADGNRGFEHCQRSLHIPRVHYHRRSDTPWTQAPVWREPSRLTEVDLATSPRPAYFCFYKPGLLGVHCEHWRTKEMPY